MSTRALVLSAVLGLMWVTACASPGTSSASGSATTTLNPPPGPFNDTLTVTFTTDKPATLFVTTDMTDPHVASLSRLTGDSPLTVTLTRSTTFTYFSRTRPGDEETMKTATYIRAGGKVGTVKGTIVVGSVAVGHQVELTLNGTQTSLYMPLTAEGTIPFEIDNVPTGSHQLRAAADRDDDAQFLPILDYFSDAYPFTIDVADPFHASVEGVTIYLGASPSGLGTIEGTIFVPGAMLGQIVTINALSPDIFQSAMGGGMNAQALLQQLQHGYQQFASGSQETYPYAITDLQPGLYLPIPVLGTLDFMGAGLNFMVDAFHTVNLTAGEVAHRDFHFGSVTLSGAVTIHPATAPQGFVYGIVAAKNVSLVNGIQVVLMPTFFTPGMNAGDYVGNYTGAGLRDSGQFDVRAFPSTDASTTGGTGAAGNLGGPILDAFTWAINPISSQPGQVSFTSNGMPVTKDFVVP